MAAEVLTIDGSQGEGGGASGTTGLSLHATTHMEILRRFLTIEADVDRQGPDDCTVRLGSGSKCP